MALFGAGIGPVALAWGLQHTSGASASLMLTLEAVFTAVLARLWYHETLDRRVALAMALLIFLSRCDVCWTLHFLASSSLATWVAPP